MARFVDTEETVVTVDVLSRVVAGGVTNGQARATLALRPLCPVSGPTDAETPEGAVQLSVWPKTIEERRPAMKLEAIVLPERMEGHLCPKVALETKVAARQELELRSVTIPQRQITDAVNVWTQVMPETQNGSFETFLTGLDTIEDLTAPDQEDDGLVCLPTGEAELALQTKLLRAAETLEMVDAEAPGEVPKRLFDEALKAVSVFLGTDLGTHFKDVYDALDFGEYEIAEKTDADAAKPIDPEKTNLDVTKQKRQAAIEAALDAAKEACSTAQQAGADLCTQSITDCAEAILSGDCGTGEDTVKITKNLSEMYANILRMRAKFLLGQALGEQDLDVLEESLKQQTSAESVSSAQPPSSATEQAQAHVRNRLFGLDESPDLGRLFRTFVDVILTDEAQDKLVATVGGPGSRFAFLRLLPERTLSSKTTADHAQFCRWSLVKITVATAGDTNQLTQFLPATRAEAMLAMAGKAKDPRCTDRLSQIDGMQVLGRKGACNAPGVELVSADLRAAAQSFESRADALSTLAVAPLDATTPTPEIDPIVLKSGGMSVVNFDASAGISRSLGAARAMTGQSCDESFLDADDLTIGRLPYVGVVAAGPNAKTRPLWFPLSRKVTTFGRAKGLNSIQVEALIANIYAATGGTQADTLRAVAQMTADRTAGREQGLPNDKTVVIPQAEFTYLGEPVGVETGLEERVTKILPRCDFNIDRTITLPTDNNAEADDLPLPLRFGMPLRMAFASSFLGGVALTPAKVSQTLTDQPEFAVPRISQAAIDTKDATRHGRRYLRSETVGAVSVLMPDEEARKEANAYPQPGRQPAFLPDTTNHVTLRTLDTSALTGLDPKILGRSRTPAPPSTITRVIMPPIIDLDLAEQHGVFDAVPPGIFKTRSGNVVPEPLNNVPVWPGKPEKLGRVTRPRDGMRDAHLEASWGGAPILVRAENVVNDRRAVVDARIDSGSDWQRDIARWARAGRDPKERPLTPSGDGVFQAKAKSPRPNSRPIPFYPDPMATEVMIRVRLQNQDLFTQTKAGQYELITFTSNNLYPMAYPIAISMSSGSTLAMTSRAKREKVSGVFCKMVDVTVPPGLTAAVDIWAVPSAEKLAFWSELVDTAATLKAGGGAPATDGCGILGRPSPTQAEIDTMADTIRTTLLKRPIPDVCQVQTIELRHAIDKPRVAPMVVAPDGAPQTLVLRRAPETPIEPTTKQPFGNDVLATPAPLPPSWYQTGTDDPMNAAHREIEVDLGHYLAVDLPSTGAIEILARAAAPQGTPLDDPDRARSYSDRITGNYPPYPGDERGDEMRPAKDTLGFQLNPDAFPKFEKSQALWARFTNLPDHEKGNTTALLSMHALFSNRPGEGIEADIAPLFADTRARKVELKVRALSRHATAFLTRPWVASDGGYRPSVQLLPEENLSVETDWSDPIWLPASERPAPPKAAAEASPNILNRPEPVARPESEVCKRSLSTMRLWLKRPWFSSGEEEKLGIILWPRLARYARLGDRIGLTLNTQSDRKPDTPFPRPSLADTRVATSDLRKTDMLKLAKFEESHLPDFANLISRWGSDPIEHFDPSGWRDWVIPPRMFADFTDSASGKLTSRRKDAAHVEDLRLPLKEPRSDEQAIADTRYLNVDLLTFAPRFHAHYERWYVDITLDPGQMVSPFLRLGVCRYQQYAPRDLQLSFAGTPFERQLQTSRKASVIRTTAADGAATINVTVRGAASPDPDMDTVPADINAATRMLIHLVGRNKTTGALEITAQERVQASTSSRFDTSPEVTWQSEFQIPAAYLADDRLDLEVYIEERAHRPGAGTAHTEAESKLLGPAGTRYSCKLKVP